MNCAVAEIRSLESQLSLNCFALDGSATRVRIAKHSASKALEAMRFGA
jgi:hypothetical protein